MSTANVLMSCCNSNPMNVEFPNVWDRICGLRPSSERAGDAMIMSLELCKCSRVSLLLSANIQKVQPRGREELELVCFSLLADLQQQLRIPLWTSEPCRLLHEKKTILLYTLFLRFIEGILQYGPEKEAAVLKIESHIDSGTVAGSKHFKGMFMCAFLSLVMCVCFYEAPLDIRSWCVEAVEGELVDIAGENWKALLEAVGSNIEEQLMRSMALLATNRLFKLGGAYWDKSALTSLVRMPFPYSYASSCTKGLWKLKIYAPLLAMAKIEDKHSSAPCKDEDLLIALSYLHTEALLQLTYHLFFTPDWIEVRVAVDNIRCNVVPLAMSEAVGVSEEKHFPSAVSIVVGPSQESNVFGVSLNRSSGNPSYEISKETSVESGFEVPGTFVAAKVAGKEGTLLSMTPWQMEQSVQGNRGSFDWILYDTLTAKQVSSSKPSKVEWVQPKAWFKDRYSSAFRPFTRQGGVVFAADKYSDCISWRVKPDMEGQIMKWEVGGNICATYWPNKYRTFYCETRRLDFSQHVNLPLLRSAPSP